MPQLYYDYVKSPVGDFLVAGTDKALHFSGFTTGHQQREPADDWIRDNQPLVYAIPQFQAYFASEPVDFNVPLNPVGTHFQQLVWTALQSVKFGHTASYGDIAKLIGKPGASRAVGAANAANHLPIVIPCHRIIGANGSLTGFGGGLDTKERLLQHEGIGIHQNQLSLI